MNIRIAGAIAFKNYVKRNWKCVSLQYNLLILYIVQPYLEFQEEDQPDHIHANDRLAIKNLIVRLMLNSPEAIQKQLSEAISVIGSTDFPLKWPELITQMVENFATGMYRYFL